MLTPENPVTYVCIDMHGSVLTTNINGDVRNPYPQVIITPDTKEFEMVKYTFAFPGYCGITHMGECNHASKILHALKHINPHQMTARMDKFLESEVEIRTRSIELIIQDAKKNRNYDKSLRAYSNEKIPSWDNIEPKNGFFYYKTYSIDEVFDENLHSITILNGKHKGKNILDMEFLSKFENLQDVVDASVNNIQTFYNGLRVLKSIDLVQIMRLLKILLGISNVYIIDPHCSAAHCHDSLNYTNAALLQNAFNDLRVNYTHGGDGHIVYFNEDDPRKRSSNVGSSETQPSPAQKLLTDCVNCDNTTALAAGVTCCLATSLFLGSPAVGAAPVIQYGIGTGAGLVAKTVTNEIYPVDKNPYDQFKPPVSQDPMKRYGGAKKRTNRKKRKRLGGAKKRTTRKKRKRSTRKKRN